MASSILLCVQHSIYSRIGEQRLLFSFHTNAIMKDINPSLIIAVQIGPCSLALDSSHGGMKTLNSNHLNVHMMWSPRIKSYAGHQSLQLIIHPLSCAPPCYWFLDISRRCICCATLYLKNFLKILERNYHLLLEIQTIVFIFCCFEN